MNSTGDNIRNWSMAVLGKLDEFDGHWSHEDIDKSQFSFKYASYTVREGLFHISVLATQVT